MTNATLEINFLSCKEDNTLMPFSCTWGDLRTFFAPERLRTGEKDGAAWIPCSAHFKDGLRRQENMNKAYLLVLDIDTGMALDDVKRRLTGLEALVHSTYSYTPEHPKWRVIMPLAEPVPVGELRALFDYMQERFDGLLDANCGHDTARFYFLPSCPVGNETLFVSEHIKGNLLDPAALLGKRPVDVATTVTPTGKNDSASQTTTVTARGDSGAPRRPSRPVMHLIPEGQRNATLTSVAGRLRSQGGGQKEIEAALVQLNDNRCDPPLATQEVQRIAASMMRYPATADAKNGIALTDTGNGQLFATQHGKNVRYVPELAKWLIWRDGQWEIDTDGAINERAKETAKSMFVTAASGDSDASRMARARHASQSLNRYRLQSMIAMASTERSIVLRMDNLDADDFLLGVQNGTVDLRDGSFHESRREEYLTQRSLAYYDKDARCPVFQAFLHRVTGGDIEFQNYLQRLIGYVLTGSTAEHCFGFLYGHGANGKSTFLEVIMRLCGSYATQTQPETWMARRGDGASSDIARLVGKRLVVSNEVREGAQLEENLVKQMVAGDVVTARYLYQEHFEFRPKLKLLMAGNHQPIIKGDDEGIWRRVHLIPFTETIPEPERDKHLGAKLAAELSGILNWAIEGCLIWRREGLNPPSAITNATKVYRDDMDLFANWIDEECIVSPGAKGASRHQLYASYQRWCASGGIKPLSQPAFGRKLAGRGFETAHTKAGNILIGIALKPLTLALVA